MMLQAISSGQSAPALVLRKPVPTVPTESFAELAFELKLLIDQKVMMHQDLEVFIAGLGDSASYAMKCVLADSVQATAKITRLYGMVLGLIPHEPVVRAILSVPSNEAASLD